MDTKRVVACQNMIQYIKHIIVSFVTLTFAILSCKSDKRDLTSVELFGNIPSQLADTLQQIGQSIQSREMDPTTDNVVIGTNGTRFFISANSFVDEKGNLYADKIVFEIKENYSISDFVTSNLQTIHNNQLLQTQGMIYFNVKGKNGQTIKINKVSSIRIEFPVNDLVAGAKIFKGHRDSDGNINWDTIVEPSNLLIPFPIRTLAPQSFGECPKDFGITNDRKYYNDHKGDIYHTFDTISKYENTLLATREFKERFYSYCMPDLTRIYIANLDKNLWEIDEMMVQYFIKDSTERVNLSINNKPTPFFKGQKVTREEQWQAYQWLIDHAKESGHNMIEVFKKFASQKLTKIDTSKRVDTTIIKETNTAFVSYEALEFGWVNVDFFYNDPKAEKTKLIAKTNKEAMTINLIIPSKQIILTGISKGNNTYWFTKQEDGYNKLPKGEKAIIVCMSIYNNKLYFADKDIIIGRDETIPLNLAETTGEMIKLKMKNYGG